MHDEPTDLTLSLLQTIADLKADCTIVGEEAASGSDADWEAVLDALITRFFTRCHSGMHCVRGTFRSGDLNVPFRSTSNTPFPKTVQCDWGAVFDAVLTRIDGEIDQTVLYPIREVDLNQYDTRERVDRFWSEYDLHVLRSLWSRGVTICTNYINRPQATPGAVIVWCSKSVAEFFFEIKGWSDDDVEISAFAGEIVRSNGNVDAYRWIKANRDGIIREEDFAPKDLFNEGRREFFAAVLEGADNHSVKTPKAIEYIVTFMLNDDVRLTSVVLDKVVVPKKSGTDLRHVLSLMQHRNDAQELAFQTLGGEFVKPRKIAKANWTKANRHVVYKAALAGDYEFVKAAVDVYGAGSYPDGPLEKNQRGVTTLAYVAACSRNPELISYVLESGGEDAKPYSHIISGILTGLDHGRYWIEFDAASDDEKDAIKQAMEAFFASGCRITEEEIRAAIDLLQLFAHDGEFLPRVKETIPPLSKCWEYIQKNEGDLRMYSRQWCVKQGYFDALDLLIDEDYDSSSLPVLELPNYYFEGHPEAEEWLKSHDWAYRLK